jgi:hypothetical protein
MSVKEERKHMTKNELIEELSNALSYAKYYGKDGKWSYEMLYNAVDSTLMFLDQEQIYRALIGK